MNRDAEVFQDDRLRLLRIQNAHVVAITKLCFHDRFRIVIAQCDNHRNGA